MDHPTVSRRHLELRWEAAKGCHTAYDLHSRNGTLVDGAPLASAPRSLSDNTVVQIGDVLAVYERRAGEIGRQVGVDEDDVRGRALGMQALRATLSRVAHDMGRRQLPVPALLIGESGTGKERIARELHRLSGRKGALKTLNCSAVSPLLAESALFGHEVGSFTDAKRPNPGFFRAADRGTLFLDEIGELPLELQPKLLRAVEGEVTAVGSTHSERVDVQIVAATNRELTDEVERDRFRRDLYARLALRGELRVPPLRHRRVDILDWLDSFVAKFVSGGGVSTPTLDLECDAAAVILLAEWPENLRGLHRLAFALVDHLSEPIGRALLPAWLRPREPTPEDPESIRRPSLTREALVAALELNRWSVRATAHHLQRDRRYIARSIERFEIVRPGKPPRDPDEDD